MTRITETVEAAVGYVCDACGEELPGEPADMWLAAHSDGEVACEWHVHGDFCPECGDKLLGALLERVWPLERYAHGDADSKVAAEAALVPEAAGS